jgi:hypothetical protein
MSRRALSSSLRLWKTGHGCIFASRAVEGDYHVGQILDALKDMGIDNDTIVLFCSDNPR